MDGKDLPCLNCRLIEMGEMACYTERCPQCGNVPPCRKDIYPELPSMDVRGSLINATNKWSFKIIYIYIYMNKITCSAILGNIQIFCLQTYFINELLFCFRTHFYLSWLMHFWIQNSLQHRDSNKQRHNNVSKSHISNIHKTLQQSSRIPLHQEMYKVLREG